MILRLSTLIASIVAVAAVCAQPITYQGQLKDGGLPASGSYNLTFELFNAASGGAQVGPTINSPGHLIANGLFTVNLNFGHVYHQGDRWLQIIVNGTTLVPRIKINVTPYAMYANRLILPYWDIADLPNQPVFLIQNTATSGNPTGLFAQAEGGTGNGVTGRYVSTAAGGNGVYGETWSQSGHGIAGTAMSSSGTGIGTGGYTNAANGRGVYGEASSDTGAGVGVYGQSYAPNGTGVFGHAITTIGIAHGVHGQADGSGNRGVFGHATHLGGGGVGVYGRSDGGGGAGGKGVHGVATHPFNLSFGVYGTAQSTAGSGVVGESIATTGFTYGGQFHASSSAGRAVYARSNATTGTTYGALIENLSANGFGVHVHNQATTGPNQAGYFQADSPQAHGVSAFLTSATGSGYALYGRSEGISGVGVYGLAQHGSGFTFGVFGRAQSPNGYGLYSVGNFAATGGKSFQMDHPLMPETHFLNHYCTEGAEPLNVYSGNVVTDEKGLAVVQLPDYFAEINRDVRYQLTCVGQFAQAIVKEKVVGHRFVIQTDKPNVEVSWRVEGVRNDRWMREHGFQAEKEKPEELKGRYLHPEFYGQPAEQRIGYERAIQPGITKP